jgi:hypothetical protein
VAVNVAVALARREHVSVFWMPIFTVLMFHDDGRRSSASTNKEKLAPGEAYGVKMMSIGFLVKPDQP